MSDAAFDLRPRRDAAAPLALDYADAETLIELLRRRAAADDGGPALRFLHDGETVGDTLDYRTLDRQARVVAAHLQAVAAPGDRALILLNSGPDYVASFFGCLYAGVIAVPAYPPEGMSLHHVERLQGMIEDAGAALLLTDRRHQASVEALRAGPDGAAVVAVDTLSPALANACRPHPAKGGDIAFLQYTSGSTANPKGIEVTHGNLIDNQRMMVHGGGITADDVLVSWLPLYHDMGLIAGLILPFFAGVPLVLMSPQHFLARPARWLEAIHRFGGTFSGGPDFAFRLCVERVSDKTLAGLDLRSWQFAFCGSEPVRADTMADFAARFAPAGFRRETLAPSYGLAEATLTMSCSPRPHDYVTLRVDPEALAAHRVVPSGEGVELVSSGRPIRPEQLRIVDPATLETLGEDVVGEVWVAGGSVTRGYWRNPKATGEAFFDRRNGDWGEGIWLRSGDLAFLHEGELYITGRRKDVIIIRGQNRYPQDIEKAVEAGVPEIRKGRVSAFAVEQDGRESIGVAVEISRETQRKVPTQALVEAVERVIVDTQQEPAALVALLDPGTLPKTTSGKLQRSACRDRLLSGELRAFHLYRRPSSAAGAKDREPPREGTERRLAAIWSELLDCGPIGRGDQFLALGGHSLLALQAIDRIRAEFGVELPLREIFAPRSLAELAARLDAAPRQAPEAGLPPVTAEPRHAGMPLSLAQQRLWLAERLAGEAARSAYNLTGQLRLTGPLSRPALERALPGLLARHEILRTAYPEDADGVPAARIDAEAALPLPEIDLSALDPARREARLAEIEAEEARRPFDLAAAPLLRATLLRLGPAEHSLLLGLHHIVADGWSIGVLIDDLGALYRAALAHGPADLPPLPVQYLDYAQWQRRLLQGDLLERQKAFWRDRLAGVPQRLELPADRLRPAVASQAGDSVRFSLPGLLVARLEALGHARGGTLFMVLLAAFEALLHRAAGATDFVIGTDVAGRPRRELDRLVGFFVNVLPLRARPASDLPFSELLDRVREDSLAAFEQPLLPFDQIVEAVGAPRDRARNPLVQVLFVLQSAPRGRFGVDGLTAELWPAQAHGSKFDMALFLDPLGPRAAQGLDGEWVFATDLFARPRVGRLVAAWTALLEQIAETPDRSLSGFTLPPLEESAMSSTASPSETTARMGAKLDKLKKFASPSARPAAAAPTRELVRTSSLTPGAIFPLVVEPASADLDAVAWAAAHRDQVEAWLRRHAGLLFRGFGLTTPQEFEAFAEALQPGLYGSYGDLPKKEGGRNTYRSTPYPERKMILYHNESSHLPRWPRKQWFFCEQPSPVGGATPIVDCREMVRRLPAELAERFDRLGLTYVRTFTENLDVDWRDFFKTDSREEVEARCRAARVDFAWIGQDELQTRTRCPAVITHPLTGERSFFNQVQLHHTRCLDADVREDLLAMVGPERMPRQVFYGDGSPIEDEVMDLIGELYEACAVRFDWRRGDVVMLDNMLAAHARDPYEGPRRIVVAMGDMVDRSALGQEGAR
ncbi:condensation domain-containing protein [Inquilinus limosus]|uniref:condensation domain-containing protein n=1 Tax=Inquilinus limosus TaxID=171674 RepID=UPI001C52CBAD|nr:condensation domain-containing protein [Inquilinus limosus]